MAKIFRLLTLISAAAGFTLATCDASAAVIKITCEKRANRSKISVDGSNLTPGVYKARVISGDKRRTSELSASIGDEVEFDFDSARNQVGATLIKRQFIQGGTVIGKILDEQGRTVISDTEQCVVR